MLTFAGCSSIPVGSILPLARIDLMTTDLERLRAALRLPRALRPSAAGVSMDVVLKLDGLPGETTSFSLVPASTPADLETLPAGARADGTTYVYRLAGPDIVRFDALRRKVAAERSGGRGGSLGLGIAAREFCGAGPLPAGPLPLSTYLRTSENAGYVIMLEGFDLRGDATLESALTHLEPC
jgi:hypothetical protein